MFDNHKDSDSLRACLETFASHWIGHRQPWYGIADEKLATTRLPKPLQWLYGFAGEWPSGNYWESVFAYQDRLLPFEALFTRDEKLVFVSENQGVWIVGTLPEGNDPPVWVRMNEESETWHLLCDSLMEFLVSFCLHEIVFAAPYVGHLENVLDHFSDRGCHISPLWLNGSYVGMDESIQRRSISFHIVDGTYLVMDNDTVGTRIANPWERFPDVFRMPAVSEETVSRSSVPMEFREDIPSFIRKKHLESLIEKHKRQADYHLEKCRRYEQMMNNLDHRHSDGDSSYEIDD
ncbi:MAG: hypothetical protein FJ267_13900 [Planctomycetes bacterium]|nr:hypothetical protein [Planctomycetota bacterium]